MPLNIGPPSFFSSPFNSDWVFLGQATANAAVRTNVVSWVGVYQQLMFECYISGYSNTSVGRLIVGPSTGLSETGTTFCVNLIENATLTQTAVSIPGWPLGVTVENVRRHAWIFVKNDPAAVKSMTGFGNNAGTAATAVPKAMLFDGLFSDTTNSIQQAELASYAAITGATIGTRTFNAGTYLNVWGKNNN
jgi:hypothetical protein